MANTFGYGAMSNSFGDIHNTKAILMIGANPAVNHPVGFSHYLKAKERGAKLIVVDPRFTRTAAKSDYFCQIRPGTDIPFMYGMLHIIFKNGWEDKKFIEERTYGFDLIREEAAKWTPEKTADVTGVPAELLLEITEVYAKNTPGTLAWNMGITQHTIGSSNTRMCSIVQMALGNVGKEGSGVSPLRGHDNVQGATDMGCLADTLPGYYGLADGSWKWFAKQWQVDYEWLKGQFQSPEWMNKKGFTLARWWAGALNGKDGNDKIHNGKTGLKALLVFGTGITSVAQQAKIKEGLDALEMSVFVDPFVNEAAVLTEKEDNVFILPAATQFETSGMVSATNRSAQWRSKIVEPLYESKTDHDIMFEFARRLGFFEQYTEALRNGKSDFTFPEDATREISRTIRTIGLNGWQPERLKKQSENWHMFDRVSLRGFGEMAGEYYGLPWPCWSKTHGGSPLLYNTDRSVKDGGMGFRNRFGLEHEGVSQLASEGSAPKDSPIQGGYPEITKANIEEVLGITLTEDEKARMGANWKVDASDIIAEKCMEHGIAPYGNARGRANVWGFPDKIPMHREPLHSPREDLVKEYPSYEDKPNHFRVDTQYISKQTEQEWVKNFPTNLITGRLVNMNGAGMENRASKYLAALTPEMYCDMNPEFAKTLDVKNGDMVWIYSPEGTKIKVRAKLTHSVSPDRVFLPFHFAGHFQGEDISYRYPKGTKPYAVGESANTVANYGYDIITQIPETKGGLCRVEKA